MRISDLASRLVSATTDAERKRLIKTNLSRVGSELARQIIDICYSAWSVEPKRARKAAAAMRILARYSNDRETAAILHWVEGISELTHGRFAQAVVDLRRSARMFRRQGKPLGAARTQVPELIALAHSGRYADADRIGRAALAVFISFRDQLAAGKVEMNLSNVAARRERHAEAERYCSSALRRFRRIGAIDWQTMAENGLANTFAETNDFRKAEKYYSMALVSARRAGMRVTVAEIEASMGNLATFRGRFADALKLLESSRQRFAELGMPHQSTVAELEIADIYSELNLLNEAAAMFKRLSPALGKLGLRAEEARSRFRLGQAAAAQGDVRTAIRELEKAGAIYETERNRVGRARVRLEIARLRLNMREFSEAGRVIAKAITDLDDSGNRRLLLAAQWLKAEIARRRGKYSAAKQQLNLVLKTARRDELIGLAASALNSIGEIDLARGDLWKAEQAFENAVAITERQRAPIASDEIRISFMGAKLEPFERLVEIALAKGDVEGAFLNTERMRARSLVETMDSEISPAESDRKLTVRLQSIREELNWYYSKLSRADEAETKRFEKQVAARERSIAELTRQIEGTTSRRAKAVNGFDVIGLRKALGKRNALVEFVRTGDTYSAFVVSNEGTTFAADLTREDDISSLLNGLRFQFSTFRLGSNAISRFVGDLERRTQAYLARLHSALFAPIADAIGDRDIVIVPSGLLNYVTFQALFDGARYEVEKRVISYSPSAATWMSLRARSAARTRRTLLIGHADENIPLAGEEIRSIARQFPDADVLVGRRATFEGFMARAPSADVIHFACHGRFRGDNPTFSSLHLADGWVTVRDIYRQRLRAGLVTLSACETGINEIRDGEEILGLSRGFLAAGTRSLVVSLWTVNDIATTRLMIEFYKRLRAGRAVPAALADAQRKFIGEGVHPYYWCPFVPIGP